MTSNPFLQSALNVSRIVLLRLVDDQSSSKLAKPQEALSIIREVEYTSSHAVVF